MTVWVVADSDFGMFHSSFRGVFSTQAKAEAFVHRETLGESDDWVIQPCDIDGAYVPPDLMD